jgi:hypothetical protein
MYINEAIEKAGEGGKIRHPNWSSNAWLFVNKEGLQFRSTSGTLRDWEPTRSMLTADDWEVVSEEIESGCIVEWQGAEYEVDDVTDDNAFLIHPFPVPINECTFISRPDKKVHTFEGVRIDRLRHQCAIAFDGEGLDLSKDYRVTFEEM